MYTELIQRCKIMYLTESDGDEDSFYQLPSFLDSIASILIHLDKVVYHNIIYYNIIDITLEGNISYRSSSLSNFFSIFSRFQRCIHQFWSIFLWCRLTAFHSTARECRVHVANLYLRCSWPWPLKDLCCGGL